MKKPYKKKKTQAKRKKMSKFLVLAFENAGWFYNNKYNKSKDFVFKNHNISEKRSEFGKYFESPITLNHISNVLHVLFGERPVSSFREYDLLDGTPIVTTNEEIVEMAGNGWIKINNKYNVKKLELIQTKKAVYNSYDKSKSILYWEKLKHILNPELYNEFIELVKKVLDTEYPLENTLEYTIDNIRKNHKDNELVKAFCEELVNKRKKLVANILIEDNDEEFYKKKSEIYRSTVNTGIEHLIRLSGEIIIEIKDDKWIQKLRSNSGTATILDGGLVFIKYLINSLEFNKLNVADNNIHGYKKISSIDNAIYKKQKQA